MLHERDMKIVLIKFPIPAGCSIQIMEKITMLLMGSTTIHPGFHTMDFHNHVNKVLALVRLKDIMVYARGNNHE